MLNALLIACGLAEPGLAIENPGLSGIPVEQKVEFKGVTAVAQPPAPALTATEIPGGLRIELDRFEACDTYNHEVTAVRSDSVLDLHVVVTAPPQAASASFQCAPDTSVNVAFEVATSGPVFQVRYLNHADEVVTTTQVSPGGP